MYTKIKEKICNILKKIPTPIWILLGISFLLMSFTLFNRIAWGHDYPFHLANIVGMDAYIEPSKGQFLISKIVGISAYDFGYGTGIFYPSLPHIFALILSFPLKLVGFNLPQTIEISKLFVLFLSGIMMYRLVKRISKHNGVALISAVSYITAPYLMTDIYVRCAFAEIFIFIFMPLILHALYELFYGDRNKFYIYFVIGYVGMILSHLVMTVYFTIMIFFIFLFKIKDIFKWKYIKPLLVSSFVILLLTSPFYIPLLEHKIFGDYVVFQNGSMIYDSSFQNNTLSFGQFFSFIENKTSGMHFEFNIMAVILFIIAFAHRKEIFKNKEMKQILSSLCIIVAISFILISNFFPWTKVPDILKMIQFPWRILSFMILAGSIISGFALFAFPKNQQKLALTFFVISLLMVGMNSIPTDNITYPNFPSNLFEWGMGAQHEYLPVKTKKNETYLKSRDKNISVLKGKADIEIMNDKVPNLKAQINLNTASATLELPRLYYLGYKITLQTETGEIKNIPYYENEHGFITIKVKERGQLNITYPGTKANQVANGVAIISLLGCGFWIWKKRGNDESKS